MKQRIAIIGSGISGMTAAYLLHKQHDISVFEANDYIGGHTATKDIELAGKNYAIDTGFIVFNDWTYPNFIKLMQQLGVASQPTEMSFSVKNLRENLEYNGHSLNSLFAQRRNILRPKFWRIVSDILKFNKACKAMIAHGKVDPALTLGQFMQHQQLSEEFANNYILPMCAAIWSASLQDSKAFPLQFFLQFFHNHGLLNISERPQWYTLVGGSRAYIEPLTQGYRQQIRLNTPIQSVEKKTNGYLLTAKQQQWTFDQVIFACHSDQALAMLTNATAQQRQILAAIPYADNDVILHTDSRLLPKRKLAWASWNYLLKGTSHEQLAPASVTYNMNILQRLQANTTFCVTLNNSQDIDPHKVLGRFRYAHPQFNQAMVAAQARRAEICGVNGLHFCGAYWYNGFHEDGVRSALDVCQRFGASL